MEGGAEDNWKMAGAMSEESAAYRPTPRLDVEPCKSTDFRFPTMKLFPLFLDSKTPYEQLQVKPSVYLKEMSLCTEERLKELNKGCRLVTSLPDFRPLPYFNVSPPVVLFQNAPLDETTSIVLSITNTSTVSRELKMKWEKDLRISVRYKDGTGSSGRKLAAGMTMRLLVDYTPVQNSADAFRVITFITEKNSFKVPVIGLCPRMILDLPDKIELPTTPVKVESKRTLIIRNIGACQAVANLIAHLPLKVDPDKICLEPEGIAAVTVSLRLGSVGPSTDLLTVLFESGESLIVKVDGRSEVGSVYLSHARVDLPDTYVALNREAIVSIHNSSEHVLAFQWHLFSSLEEDYSAINKLKKIYEDQQDVEKCKVAKLVHYDIFDDDIHQIVTDRITRDNLCLATPDSLYFTHRHFEISPIKGEVWPGGVCTCRVMFRSEEIGLFEAFAFLEVDGLESRLPLCLAASAVGPNIRLNIDSMDIGEIHLLQVFSAQVIAENIGDIVGSVWFVGRNEEGDKTTVSCSPQSHKLKPGQAGPFLVCLSRSTVGPFAETLSFYIDDSANPLCCLIKGSVLIPPLEFSQKLIDFGKVPLGFELVKTVRLFNRSGSQGFGFRVTVCISGYWEEEAVRAWDRAIVPSRPKQFSVYPSDGLIKPNQQIDIKVVGLFNVLECGNTVLKVSVWDNPIDHLVLPIKYSVSVPKLRSLEPEIFINFAFVDFVYYREVNVINDSASTAFFSAFATEGGNGGIECCLDESDGVIKPYDCITLHIGLAVKTVGKHSAKLMLKMFGACCSVMTLCQISMFGVDPVLNLDPMELDWGEVLVLVPTPRSFTISNVSPVPTEFSISMEKGKDSWSTSVKGGAIEADSSIEVEVLLSLCDAGLVEGLLAVKSIGSLLRLTLKATGVGCAVVTAPSLCPSFDLGHLISSVSHEMDVMVINKSTWAFELLWSTCDNLSNWTKSATDENQGEYLKIVPYRMTLKAGECETVKLMAYCKEEKDVEEVYYCLGMKSGETKGRLQRGEDSPIAMAPVGRKTLGECCLTASFHYPRLRLSRNEINFCIGVSPLQPFPSPPTERLIVIPDFSQEVEMEVEVRSPFKLVLREEESCGGPSLVEFLTLRARESTPIELVIMFDSLYRTDGYSWSADGSLLFTYKNHPCKAVVALHGEVQYPNLVLSSHLVDMGGVDRQSEAYREVVVSNPGPYDILYSWHWTSCCITPIQLLPTPSTTNATMTGNKVSDESGEINGIAHCNLSDRIRETLSATDESGSSVAISVSSSSGRPIIIDVRSTVQEILNLLVSEGPYPEDCNIDEEERGILRDMALVIVNSEDLFDKVTAILQTFKPDLLNVPAIEVSVGPSRWVVEAAVSMLRKLQDLVLKEETLAGFHGAVLPFVNRFIRKGLLDTETPLDRCTGLVSSSCVSRLLDLTPKWGMIASGEELVMGVVLKAEELRAGESGVMLEAVAECKVSGGPTERLCLKAVISRPVYSLQELIDLGFMYFCEVSRGECIVRNEGGVPLMFRVLDGVLENGGGCNAGKRNLIVEPQDGCLPAGSQINLKIMCLPTEPGPIDTFFHVELGVVDVIKVKVVGMAVMAQVLLDLPSDGCDLCGFRNGSTGSRSGSSASDSELGYRAVASLTHPAFSSILRSPGKAGLQSNTILSSSSTRPSDQSSSSTLLSDRIALAQSYGFTLVQPEEVVSLLDIRLALEREIMLQCISGEERNSRYHSSGKPLKQLQTQPQLYHDCVLPPYSLDIGSVIINTVVERRVEVWNAGYVDAEVEIKVPIGVSLDNSIVANQGVSLVWEGPRMISSGSLTSFILTLSPKSHVYTGSFYNLDFTFVLQVNCGGRIAVRVKAFFVQPEISVKPFLEFGEVKCSHSKSAPLVVTNIGTVEAVWSLKVRNMNRKNKEWSVAQHCDKGESPFHCDKMEGTLLPLQSDTIVISFLPPQQGVYERVLEVAIKDSRSIPKCKLRGSSLEPKINLNQLTLDFGTVYPYSSIYEQDLTVHNPCPFPVQIVLLDYDSDCELENRVLRAMCRYYGAEMMQLPLKYCDTIISPILVDMYKSMARLGAFLALSRAHHSNIESTGFEEDGGRRKSKLKAGGTLGPKGGKISSSGGGIRMPRKKSRSKSKRSSSLTLTEDISELEQFLMQRSPAEIEELVNEYIDWVYNIPEKDLVDSELMEKMNLKTELTESLYAEEDSRRGLLSLIEDITNANSSAMSWIEHSSQKQPFAKGMFLIFYGAPFTESVMLARKAGRELGVKAVSLDTLVIEEAALGHGPSAVTFREMVNAAYTTVLAEEEAVKVSVLEQQTEINTSLANNPSKSVQGMGTLESSRSPSTSFKKNLDKVEGDVMIDPVEDLESKVNAILEHTEKKAQKREEEAAARAAELAAAAADMAKDRGKTAKKSGKSTATTKSTKESSRLLKKDAYDEATQVTDTFLDISFDVIQDLIAYRLKLDIFENGLVVDSLTGRLIRNSVKSLEMLLNIAGPVGNMYFVNIFHSYEAFNILRQHRIKTQEMDLLKEAEEKIEMLRKKGCHEQKLSKSERKDWFRALDLYHNTAVATCNNVPPPPCCSVIVETSLPPELASLAAEVETTVGVGTNGRIKMSRSKSSLAMTTRGDETRSHDLVTVASTAVRPTEAKSKISLNADKKKKKGKKVEVEEVEEEVPAIPPEELKIMNQFKIFKEDFTKIYSLLEGHNRLKVTGEVERGSGRKGSVRSNKRSSRSRLNVGSITSAWSPTKHLDDPDVSTKSCPQSVQPGEECAVATAAVGVPIVIINNANLSTELMMEAQISGLKTIILPPQPKSMTKGHPLSSSVVSLVGSKSLVQADSERCFWYKKPEELLKERLINVFSLEDTRKPAKKKEMSFLIRVRPQFSMPAVKESLPQVQAVRRVSPAVHVPVVVSENRRPSSLKLFKKKTSENHHHVEKVLTTRLILGATELASWTISFYPEKVGKYKQDVRIGVTGWPRATSCIKVTASVQLPDIVRTPQDVFANVLEDVEDVPEIPTFLTVSNVLDFGYILDNSGCPDQSLNPVITKLKLSNCKKLTANLDLSLNFGTHFELEQNHFNLKEGECCRCIVKCNPQGEGRLQDQLFCSITHNPEPFIVQLSCTGVRGELTVKPKDLLFGKTLVKQGCTKTLMLISSCPLPLYWTLTDQSSVCSIICSITSGLIEPLGKTLVHVSFKSPTVQHLDTALILHVFDTEGGEGVGEPILLQSIDIPVKGEAYDVLVSVCFPDSPGKGLYFGDIKVGTENWSYFLLNNNGPYDINFRIDFDKFPYDVNYSPAEIFMLSLEEGTLPPKAKLPTKVEVKARCIEEVKLSGTPILRIVLLEGSSEVVGTVSIPVFLSSHFTKLRLVPKDEVGFGCVLLGDTKTLYLTVENTGLFDFTYKILSKAELELAMVEAATHNLQKEEGAGGGGSLEGVSMSMAAVSTMLDTDRSTMTRSPETARNKKGHSDKKQVGVFTVFGVAGLVKRDSSVKIKVNCSPDKEANFKEMIVVQASELPEALRFGLPVAFVATGCVPSVDFSNKALIYREAVFFDNSTKLLEDDGLPRVVYREDSGLEFCNVIVSTSKSMKVYLHNNGMVSSNVKMIVTNFVGTDSFSISSSVLYLAPYTTESFTLSFNPSSVEVTESLLEMCVEMPRGIHVKGSSEHVYIKGRGCLPLVELVSPVQVRSCTRSDKSLLDLGTCLVRQHLSTVLTFTNPSTCYSKFIIELKSEVDTINCFSLVPLPNYKQLARALDSGSKTARLRCEARPGAEVQISCVFTPMAAVSYTSIVKVHIVDNPYENLKTTVCGRGYSDAVILESLPFLLEANSPSMINLKMSGKGGMRGNIGSTYLLDYGAVCVGRPLKEEMKLRNQTECWIRYTWDQSSCPSSLGLRIYPRSGALPPRSTVMIYAVLFPPTPVRLTKAVVKCFVEQVVPEEACLAQWNCHEKVVAWLKHEDKRLGRYDVYCKIPENEGEPIYSEINRLTDIRVQVQAEADKPSVTCDLSHISFPETLICQGSWSDLVLKNPRRVVAKVTCNVVLTRAVPLNAEAKAVFSIGRLTDESQMYMTQSDDSGSSSLTPSSRLSSSINEGSKHEDRAGLKRYRPMEEWGDEVGQPRGRDGVLPTLRVEPDSLHLDPDTSAILRVHFTPVHMFSYTARLIFSVEDGEEGVEVEAEGCGLPSYCHIDVEDEEDHLASLSSNTTTLIINMIGVPASGQRKFGVINPTDREYYFEWIECGREDGVSAGRPGCQEMFEHICITPSGLIRPHKCYDMEFKMSSSKTGTFHNLWTLRILDLKIEHNILFKTIIREPTVRLAWPLLALDPTIPGARVSAEVTLHNDEDIELKYEVDRCSLYSEGRYERLDVEPMTGVLLPKQPHALRVSLIRKKAGDVDFVMSIVVGWMRSPLRLRVTSLCLSIEALVSLQADGAGRPMQLSSSNTNPLRLGHLEVRVPRRVELEIRNVGSASFYAEISKKGESSWKRSCLQVDWDSTFSERLIAPSDSLNLTLFFSALTNTTFDHLPLLIKIIKGAEYEVEVSGEAASPKFSFSFTQYDFGPRFIQSSDNQYNTAKLILTNEHELSIEVEKVSNDSDELKVELEHAVLNPRSALSIIVKFYPRRQLNYHFDVEFLINGIYSTLVQFTGTGVPLKIELLKTKDKVVEFGGVLVGETACRTVEVINRSIRGARLRLMAQRLSPDDNDPGYFATIKPEEVTIAPEAVVKLTLSFAPQKRGVSMAEKVWAECEDERVALSMVEGRGIGAEMRLDREMVALGVCTVDSTRTVRLALLNTGDLGARFAWDMSKASECLDIEPKDGYSTAGSVLTFDLTFSPTAHTPNTLRNQIECVIENMKTPLKLVVSGSCAQVPPPKDFVKFICPVRQAIMKSIPLHNQTPEKWVLYPTVSGEYFSGEAVITVLPKTTVNYDVTYSPMTMTDKKSNHEGSVLVSLPDGQAYMYGLRGLADVPFRDPCITWITSAKKHFVGQLPINNWLTDRCQRFSVVIKGQGEGIKALNKNLYKIYGNAQIEVGPSASRLYDVHFFSYLPATLDFIVTYTNDSDGELGWVDVRIIVTDGEVLEERVLTTQVRKMVELDIPVYNPLETKQNLLTVNSDPQHLQISSNAPLVLPSKQTVSLKIRYLPVVEEDQKIVVTVKCSGLGEFLYRLLLTAEKAPLPPVIQLTASLGSNQSYSFTLTNYTPRDTVFTIMSESRSLICPKDVKVRADGCESLTILYEPVADGSESITLSAVSAAAGTFKFGLSLKGTPPVPRGPLEIRRGGVLTLNFKNIFLEPKEFVMTSESDLLIIKDPRRLIKSKQEAEFNVVMASKVEGNDTGGAACKVMVSPVDPSLSHLCWLFYIKAHF